VHLWCYIKKVRDLISDLTIQIVIKPKKSDGWCAENKRLPKSFPSYLSQIALVWDTLKFWNSRIQVWIQSFLDFSSQKISHGGVFQTRTSAGLYSQHWQTNTTTRKTNVVLEPSSVSPSHKKSNFRKQSSRKSWDHAALLSLLQPILMDPISRVPYPVDEVPFDEAMATAVQIFKIIVIFLRDFD